MREKQSRSVGETMATKYYKITEKELMDLIAVTDTCMAMVGCGDDGVEREAKAAQKAITAIGKRHGVEFERDYSSIDLKY